MSDGVLYEYGPQATLLLMPYVGNMSQEETAFFDSMAVVDAGYAHALRVGLAAQYPYVPLPYRSDDREHSTIIDATQLAYLRPLLATRDAPGGNTREVHLRGIAGPALEGMLMYAVIINTTTATTAKVCFFAGAPALLTARLAAQKAAGLQPTEDGLCVQHADSASADTYDRYMVSGSATLPNSAEAPWDIRGFARKPVLKFDPQKGEVVVRYRCIEGHFVVTQARLASTDEHSPPHVYYVTKSAAEKDIQAKIQLFEPDGDDNEDYVAKFNTFDRGGMPSQYYTLRVTAEGAPRATLVVDVSGDAGAQHITITAFSKTAREFHYRFATNGEGNEWSLGDYYKAEFDDGGVTIKVAAADVSAYPDIDGVPGVPNRVRLFYRMTNNSRRTSLLQHTDDVSGLEEGEYKVLELDLSTEHFVHLTHDGLESTKKSVKLGEYGIHATWPQMPSGTFTDAAIANAVGTVSAPAVLSAPGALACPAGTVPVTHAECASAAALARPAWAWPSETYMSQVFQIENSDSAATRRIPFGCSVLTGVDYDASDKPYHAYGPWNSTWRTQTPGHVEQETADTKPGYSRVCKRQTFSTRAHVAEALEQALAPLAPDAQIHGGDKLVLYVRLNGEWQSTEVSLSSKYHTLMTPPFQGNTALRSKPLETSTFPPLALTVSKTASGGVAEDSYKGALDLYPHAHMSSWQVWANSKALADVCVKALTDDGSYIPGNGEEGSLVLRLQCEDSTALPPSLDPKFYVHCGGNARLHAMTGLPLAFETNAKRDAFCTPNGLTGSADGYMYWYGPHALPADRGTEGDGRIVPSIAAQRDFRLRINAGKQSQQEFTFSASLRPMMSLPNGKVELIEDATDLDDGDNVADGTQSTIMTSDTDGAFATALEEFPALAGDTEIANYGAWNTVLGGRVPLRAHALPIQYNDSTDILAKGKAVFLVSEEQEAQRIAEASSVPWNSRTYWFPLTSYSTALRPGTLSVIRETFMTAASVGVHTNAVFLESPLITKALLREALSRGVGKVGWEYTPHASNWESPEKTKTGGVYSSIGVGDVSNIKMQIGLMRTGGLADAVVAAPSASGTGSTSHHASVVRQSGAAKTDGFSVSHEHLGNVDFNRFKNRVYPYHTTLERWDSRYGATSFDEYNAKHKGVTSMNVNVSAAAVVSSWSDSDGGDALDLKFSPSREDSGRNTHNSTGTNGTLFSHRFVPASHPLYLYPADAVLPKFRVMIDTRPPHRLRVGKSASVDTGLDLEDMFKQDENWRWWFNFPSTFGYEGWGPNVNRARFRSETGFSNLTFVTEP